MGQALMQQDDSVEVLLILLKMAAEGEGGREKYYPRVKAVGASLRASDR
jgi:hypothetical protein